MPAPWRGYYINLDTSPERRAAIETTLARAGLTGLYQRFSARTGEGRPATCHLNPGEYGCFRSHHDLLAGLTPDGSFVHVLEDDAILAQPFGPAMQSVIAGGLMEPFDIVFTDIMVPGDLGLIRTLKGLFDRNTGPGRPPSLSLVDLAEVDFAVMASYFVNPRSLGRVVEYLGQALAAGPPRPVDLQLREEVRAGRLKAGVLFPFLSSVAIDARSTIARQSASEAVSILLRNSFFIEADIAASRRAMADIMRGLGPWPPDPRLDLITDILRFNVSDRFRQF